MKLFAFVILILTIVAGAFVFSDQFKDIPSGNRVIKDSQNTITSVSTNPLSISAILQKKYPGSNITIEQTLSSGPNYSSFLVSYTSDNLKIYGLLTVPLGNKPQGGWPVIVFNHGYIPPAEYSTISSYEAMIEPLSSAGFIVFKPDYRGNGNSQGVPTQPYVTNSDVTDSMNAISSIKKFKGANPNKIGVMSHSMGGNILMHEIVISKDIKAAVFLSGVVGDETQIYNWWQDRFANKTIIGNDLDTYYKFEQIVKDNGTPVENPAFWNTLDPSNYIANVNIPIQIQVGTADAVVPTGFSTSFRDLLESKGKNVEFFEYPGADHNLTPDLPTALSRTISFFNKNLK